MTQMSKYSNIQRQTITRLGTVALVMVSFALGLGQTQSGWSTAHGSATSTQLAGDPATGKAIFEGIGNCLSCHRAGASGSFLGPNLSDVGDHLSSDVLKEKLLNPPATVSPKNRLYEIVTDNGRTFEGKLLNQGPISLQMLDTNGHLVAFRLSNVRRAHFVDPPAMRSYQAKLTSSQIDDIVAYLVSLRVPGTQPR
jgi:putative heme-binding domain-containing protein